MSDTETARASITALRDAARQSTMDFRERDRHVSTLHRALDALATAQTEREEYREENERLRKALSQYQQPGALVRFGVQHEPGPWLLTVMEDGYWTPWHIANADAVRLEAERDAAILRAEQAEAALAQAQAVRTLFERIADVAPDTYVPGDE